MYTVKATVLNARTEWTAAGTNLHIAGFWDDSAWIGQPAGQTTLTELASRETMEVVMEVNTPGLPGAAHILHLIANHGQPIAEATATDNEIALTVDGIAPPEQVRGNVVPGNRLVNLEWQLSDDPRIQGYRVYRRLPGDQWEPAGTSPVAGWADFRVHWDQEYHYRVRSYGYDLGESALSDMTVLKAPVKPTALKQEFKLFLPLLNRQ